jgi:hypothetical protein
MEKNQQDEVRQLITDVIGKPLEEISGRLSLINAKMVEIERNTMKSEQHGAKTNERVDKTEDDIDKLKTANVAHVVNCPNTSLLKQVELALKERKETCPYKTEIETLKSDRISRASIVKFVVGVIATTAGVVAFLEWLAK